MLKHLRCRGFSVWSSTAMKGTTREASRYSSCLVPSLVEASHSAMRRITTWTLVLLYGAPGSHRSGVSCQRAPLVPLCECGSGISLRPGKYQYLPSSTPSTPARAADTRRDHTINAYSGAFRFCPNEVWSGHTWQTTSQASRVCRYLAVRKRRVASRSRYSSYVDTRLPDRGNYSPPECDAADER